MPLDRTERMQSTKAPPSSPQVDLKKLFTKQGTATEGRRPSVDMAPSSPSYMTSAYVCMPTRRRGPLGGGAEAKAPQPTRPKRVWPWTCPGSPGTRARGRALRLPPAPSGCCCPERAGGRRSRVLLLRKEVHALLPTTGGERGYLDHDLVELPRDTNDRNNGVIRQYQSSLMHYNELQSCSYGVSKWRPWRCTIRAEGGWLMKSESQRLDTGRNLDADSDRGDSTW
jgi:hypothetical protein